MENEEEEDKDIKDNKDNKDKAEQEEDNNNNVDNKGDKEDKDDKNNNNNNKEEEEQQGCPLQLSQTHPEVPYPCLHDPRSCTHVLLFYFSHRPLECRILVHSRRSPFL